MKNCILTICVLLVVLAGGCLPMAADIQKFSGEVQTLTSKIDDYQREVTDITVLLERDGLISEEIVKKLDKANKEINRVQPSIIEIAKAVESADYVTGDDIGNLFKGAKVATIASAPVNPYAAGIMGLLTLAEIATLLLLKKKTGEANTAETRLAKTEEGINKFTGTHDPQIAG